MTALTLFDPAEYGDPGPEHRRRPAAPPTVALRRPWRLLAHLAESPLAHIVGDIRSSDGPVERLAHPPAVLGLCGRAGIPIDEIATGTVVPACPQCCAKAGAK